MDFINICKSIAKSGIKELSIDGVTYPVKEAIFEGFTGIEFLNIRLEKTVGHMDSVAFLQNMGFNVDPLSSNINLSPSVYIEKQNTVSIDNEGNTYIFTRKYNNSEIKYKIIVN